MDNKFIKMIASLKLTVILLLSSFILVFLGTLEQVDMGIRSVQEKYFESFFLIWQYPEFAWGGKYLKWIHFPLPGGYLLGGLFLLNLFGGFMCYHYGKKGRLSIALIHAGVALLLLGQLFIQLFQEEYFIWLDEGIQTHYLESFYDNELVLLDSRKGESCEGICFQVNDSDLAQGDSIQRNLNGHKLTIELLAYYPNSGIARRKQVPGFDFDIEITKGIGAKEDLVVWPKPPATKQNERNVTSAIVRVLLDDSDQGSYLLSSLFRDRMGDGRLLPEAYPRQFIEIEGQAYELAIRYKRHYLPGSITLIDFTHDRYPGTDIPKDFSSWIEIKEEGQTKGRQMHIYMNHPMRYAGFTFYQASFGNQDHSSMLQVVKNPSRLMPYISCSLISLGLLWQFASHLIIFARARRRN